MTNAPALGGRSAPDGRAQISDKALGILINWVSDRYVRESFPDEFESRLHDKKGWERIKQILQDDASRLVTNVFVRLNTQKELPAGEPYRVIVTATVSAATYSDEDLKQQAELEFLEPLVDAMQQLKGVKVVNYSLISAADFSLDDLENSQRMNFDSFSYDDD